MAAVTVRVSEAVRRASVLVPAGVAAALLVVWQLDRHVPDLRLGAVPFKGEWGLDVGLASVPAVCAGAVLVLAGPRVAGRVRWSAVVLGGAAATAGWAVLLAVSEGVDRLAAPLATRWEHLAAVPLVGSPESFLETFVSRLPDLPLHAQSHPPGTVLVLWALERLGLGGRAWAAALVIVVGASATAAVLIAVREAAGERTARRAAPFLVVAPTAVWLATSTDALYLGVGAWATTLVVVASGATGQRAAALAVGGGVVFGAGLVLSYGLLLLAAVPGAVVAARRRWDVAALAVAGALAVLVAMAVTGFSWLDGLEATRRQYRLGVASVRPYGWFLFVNLAAAAVALGPAGLVGLGAVVRRRAPSGLVLLVAGALAAVVAADVSGLSKGEVERIWLPFLPWIGVAAAALPGPDERRWLAATAATALGLQVTLRSPW